MAGTVVDLGTPSGLKKYYNADIDENIAGIDSGSGNIEGLVLDNTANAAASYLKLWNTASGSVTVGTTAPDIVILVPASTKIALHFGETGLAYGTALSAACVTTGGTAGTTPPTSAVKITLFFT